MIQCPDLFRPFARAGLRLRNRVVMAPMTRSLSPGGVPGPNVAAYYARRARHGVGLIITEGAWIDHPFAGNDASTPRFHGDDALEAWRRVAEAVHAEGGAIVPQLWHVGQTTKPAIDTVFAERATDLFHPDVVGPSGMIGGIGTPMARLGRPMTQADIDAVVASYARASRAAMALGFDGIELHAAHGYLIDQFLWSKSNLRTDRYGGSLANRAAFGAEVVAEIRRATRPDFPIIFRFSQWKSQDYAARIAETPDELEQLLRPLADAGVDIFHASQRRFWEPAFAGSDLNLAGWAKRVTGRAAITVGSIGLDGDFLASLTRGAAGIPSASRMDHLQAMLADGDFDLAGVGRALLADAAWVEKIRNGRADINSFEVSRLATLD